MRLPLISGDCFSTMLEGKNKRFGVIEFASGVDVTPKFKRAAATEVPMEYSQFKNMTPEDT